MPRIRPPRDLEVTGQQAELFGLALVGLSIILQGEIVGLVVNDDLGVAVVPRPGFERELVRCLRDAPWQSLLRQAEELT
jgi:hypothetical protein